MRRTAGFTLVELVIVIVLLAILSISVFSYLGLGARIFQDTVARDTQAWESRFALQRFSREARNALPSSLRVSADGACLEMVPIIASSAYLALPSLGNSNLALSPPTLLTTQYQDNSALFIFVAANSNRRVYEANASQRVSVDAGDIPASSSQPWLIDTGTQPFQRSSPGRRYYLTSSPVSWCIVADSPSRGRLVRYANYNQGFANLTANPSDAPSVAQLDSLIASTAQRVVMANDIVPNLSGFSQLSATLNRNSLVLLDLTVGSTGSEEILSLYHEVHIPNVP